jgi:protein-L-isoaspartate(D-aspartate) O-methyltransferase
MQFGAARLAMVESQIRPNGVRDPLLLKAFAGLPREHFVPESQRALAYMDEAIPVVAASAASPARYLLPPMILARMLQAAAPLPKDRALDIGGATGYSAAILARLCKNVEALEATEPLAEGMRQCLKAAGADAVAVHSGPLNEGLSASKPFDLILMNGGVAEEPKTLFDQLADGGRLVTIVCKRRPGNGFLFIKSEGTVSGRPIFDADAAILPGFEAKPQFVF